jgi:hypothetical protein
MPGKGYMNWSLPAPERRSLGEARASRDEIVRRVVELPVTPALG